MTLADGLYRKKIGLVSLGCPKNLVDSEVMLGLLKKEDFEITNDEHQAEIIIVNTCGFINDAKKESIYTILEMAQLKNKNCELLIVTGCLSQRYSSEILEDIPEVDVILGTGHFDMIAEAIEKAYRGEKVVITDEPGFYNFDGCKRLLTNNNGFAYLKISDGCDNFCTYCVIPSLRGHYKSRDIESIVEEAEYLVDNGVKEIILVAQDTTKYGVDLYGKKKLTSLIKEISKIENLKWIRLLYCYPDQIDDDLIREIRDNDKVCKYIDIPLQHASEKILKKMGRPGNALEIEELIIKLKNEIPDICIRTTFIVGFPGEEEEDFSILYDMVKKLKFDRMGVFMYSKEEGTPAAKLKGQIKKHIKKERYNKLMALQNKIVVAENRKKLDKTYSVLVEGVSEDGIFYFGRSYAEAPDIDSLIYFTSGYPLENGALVNVKILNTDKYDLIGDVENEFTQ